MRLANCFRPQDKHTPATKVNSKKNAKRMAANLAVLKSLKK